MALTSEELARYSRHLTLPEVGAAGQEKLRAARVLVVGAGGLGSPAALYLAASGIGKLGLVDCDRVDLSNLQRQVLFDTAGIGTLKAESARERLRALNPRIEIVAHAVELRAANVLELLGGYDIVLDGTDRLATRYVVNDACVLLRKPLVSAAIHRFEGQAMTYVPEHGPCYRCLFSDATRGVVPNCAEAGVLGVLPGVLGAIQATEAIKLITGAGEPLVGRLLTYDALQMRFEEFRFARRADCAVCGDHPSITAPFDPDALCETDMTSSELRRLDPPAVQELLRQPGYTIVDVREPHEFEAGCLPGSLHIPLGELPGRFAEIPAEATPVFICRGGGRSLQACHFALRSGRPAVVNLEGGLKAWAAQIDPGLTVA
jgi:molybdopterin/thiamine biosynthesis adenylyltransferase/rhodanese-related sulfurtransferase